MMDVQDTYTLRGICMLMIIIHHVLKLMPSCPMVIWRWGDLGTAVFFFISGWGLYCSMEKREKIDYNYLLQNLKKLFIPFFIVWILVQLIFQMIHPDYSCLKILYDGITLSFPSFDLTNLWFFKVIFLAYIISIQTFIFIENRLWRLSIISFFCCVYILLAWKILQLPRYYWCSILCFPIGMWLSAYKTELCGIMKYKMIIALYSLIIYLMFLFYDFLPMPASIKYEVAYCILMVSIVSIVNVQSKFLYFIGKNSLLFYLIHIAVLLLFTDLGFLTQSYILNLCIVFLITLFLCMVYVKSNELIFKRK